jgi:hypothetical protein
MQQAQRELVTRLRANKRCKLELSTVLLKNSVHPQCRRKIFARMPYKRLSQPSRKFSISRFRLWRGNCTFSTGTTDSVNHLYVILLSVVSRSDIADAMKKLPQAEKALEQAIVQIGHELGHAARKDQNGFPLVSVHGVVSNKVRTILCPNVQSVLAWWSIRWSDRFAIRDSGII